MGSTYQSTAPTPPGQPATPSTPPPPATPTAPGTAQPPTDPPDPLDPGIWLRLERYPGLTLHAELMDFGDEVYGEKLTIVLTPQQAIDLGVTVTRATVSDLLDLIHNGYQVPVSDDQGGWPPQDNPTEPQD